ncbi:hypothetical protein HK098_007244 [Nowakowskiella sp. JEL0407]|nr:hypothetical protein HK098_007244 [Nowakowskiella sp. JEL0407]
MLTDSERDSNLDYSRVKPTTSDADSERTVLPSQDQQEPWTPLNTSVPVSVAPPLSSDSSSLYRKLTSDFKPMYPGVYNSAIRDGIFSYNRLRGIPPQSMPISASYSNAAISTAPNSTAFPSFYGRYPDPGTINSANKVPSYYSSSLSTYSSKSKYAIPTQYEQYLMQKNLTQKPIFSSPLVGVNKPSIPITASMASEKSKLSVIAPAGGILPSNFNGETNMTKQSEKLNGSEKTQFRISKPSGNGYPSVAPAEGSNLTLEIDLTIKPPRKYKKRIPKEENPADSGIKKTDSSSTLSVPMVEKSKGINKKVKKKPVQINYGPIGFLERIEYLRMEEEYIISQYGLFRYEPEEFLSGSFSDEELDIPMKTEKGNHIHHIPYISDNSYSGEELDLLYKFFDFSKTESTSATNETRTFVSSASTIHQHQRPSSSHEYMTSRIDRIPSNMDLRAKLENFHADYRSYYAHRMMPSTFHSQPFDYQLPYGLRQSNVSEKPFTGYVPLKSRPF